MHDRCSGNVCIPMYNIACSISLVTDELSKLRELLISEYFYPFLFSKGLKSSENRKKFYGLRSGQSFLASRCWNASNALLYMGTNTLFKCPTGHYASTPHYLAPKTVYRCAL